MAKLSRNRLSYLACVLKGLGIAKVIVSYSGSGDSGQIDDVLAYDSKNKDIPIPAMQVKQTITHDVFANGAYTTETKVVDIDLAEALRGFCEDHLSSEGIDWYNNDGGQGEQVIMVKEVKAKLKHNANIQDTEYSEHNL